MTELKCRMKIQQLQTWRRNGITTLEDGAKFERIKSSELPIIKEWAMVQALEDIPKHQD